MTKAKHRLLTAFFIILFAFCIFCILGTLSTSAANESNVYDISNGTLTIDQSNVDTYNGFTITGSGNSYSNKIVIDGVSVELTIDGLNISEESSKASTHSAIELKNGATLSLLVYRKMPRGKRRQ